MGSPRTETARQRRAPRVQLGGHADDSRQRDPPSEADDSRTESFLVSIAYPIGKPTLENCGERITALERFVEALNSERQVFLESGRAKAEHRDTAATARGLEDPNFDGREAGKVGDTVTRRSPGSRDRVSLLPEDILLIALVIAALAIVYLLTLLSAALR